MHGQVLQAISADPESNARFRREAQAIGRMRHPNVLNVYDFGEYEGTPYMVRGIRGRRAAWPRA